MNASRFRPALESLDNRLMPSATAPVVTLEYLVVAAVPSPTQDDVVVDGRIITAENPASADPYKGQLKIESWSFNPVPQTIRILTTASPDSTAADSQSKHLDVLSFHWGTTQDDKNETLTVDGNRTEIPTGSETVVGIDFRPY